MGSERSNPPRPRLVQWALVASILLLASCSRTGAVSGDVYVTMASGDVKRGADVPITLVARTPAFETAWTMAQDRFRDEVIRARVGVAAAAERQSQTFKRNVAAITAIGSARSNLDQALRLSEEASARDSEARLKLRTAQDELRRTVEQQQLAAIKVIQQHQIATFRTDVNGHYNKVEVPPGRYYVFSAHKIFNNELVWFQPIDVNRAEATKLDLTGSNVGWPFDPSRFEK